MAKPNPQAEASQRRGTINLGSGEVWLMEGTTVTLDQKFTLNKGNHTIKFGGARRALRRFSHESGESEL